MKDAFVHDRPTVFVLDNDRATRDAVRAVARSLRWNVEAFRSVGDFFDACDPQRMGCLLADIHAPGLQGPKAVERLSEKGIHLPMVWLAAKPDVTSAVKAIKAGAFYYLGKPCEDEELAEVMQDAMVWDAENRRRLVFCAKVRRRLNRLSPGERQVLELLVDGRSNKGIAAELSVSIRTVEVRRAKLMKKMHVQSLAELIRAIVTVCGCFSGLPTLVEQHG